MNLEVLIPLVVAGVGGILTAIGALIKIIFKAKADYIKQTKELNKEIIDLINSNKKQVDKLSKAFGLYVENNGVKPEIKEQVKDILEKE